MTIRMVLPLLLAGAVWAQEDPTRTLFDTALHDEQTGKLQRARLTLQTLINTYPRSPLAAQARTELGAVDLFQEGRERLQDGSAGSAVVTFRTVAQVYPESPLAQRAEAASRYAEKKEPHDATTVRAIEFHGAWPISMEEIRQRFVDREIELAVEAPYSARDAERARTILVQLLREKGESSSQVRMETETLPPRAIRVVFTVVKP
jgi:outer membrane protein assembly factor BamD (BamD/ComL family)